MPNALDAASSLKLVRSCDDEEHTPLWQGRERAEHPCGWQRCGAGELREPHLPLFRTSQADHFRFLSNNHSRPIAATINTATTDHGVDEDGFSIAAAGSVDALALGAGDVGEDGATFGNGFEGALDALAGEPVASGSCP